MSLRSSLQTPWQMYVPHSSKVIMSPWERGRWDYIFYHLLRMGIRNRNFKVAKIKMPLLLCIWASYLLHKYNLLTPINAYGVCFVYMQTLQFLGTLKENVLLSCYKSTEDLRGSAQRGCPSSVTTNVAHTWVAAILCFSCQSVKRQTRQYLKGKLFQLHIILEDLRLSIVRYEYKCWIWTSLREEE